MLITFKSDITGPQTNNIEFTSKVVISKWDQYDVYEFIEPQTNTMNRIEVSDTGVNIMTGINTMNLLLGQDVQQEYLGDPEGINKISFVSHLLNIDNSNQNSILFEYTLKDMGGNLIGNYNIALDIKKEA